MISGIINLILQAAIPLINFFVKNAEKNREMKEKMFKAVENHSKNVTKNISLRRDLEELRRQARAKPDDNRIS